MASFFDIKARKAAAAANNSASNKHEKQSDGRLQPWVEK
jgi:replication factor C subunit 2/4